MDVKKSDYGPIAGETLPGDQHGEGISTRARGDIDIVDIKEEDRTGPTDPDNISFAI